MNLRMKEEKEKIKENKKIQTSYQLLDHTDPRKDSEEKKKKKIILQKYFQKEKEKENKTWK